MHRPLRIPALAFAAAVLVVGCGDDTPEESAEPDAPQDAPAAGAGTNGGDAPTPDSVCDLLTAAEIADATGAELESTVPLEGPNIGQNSCTFELVEGTQIFLGVFGAQGPEAYQNFGESSATVGTTPVPGIGDDAFHNANGSFYAVGPDWAVTLGNGIGLFDETSDEQRDAYNAALAEIIVAKL